MTFLPIALVAALVLGVCWLVDRAFTKLFRSKAQHRSGKAVRASKRYGSIGTILMVLGVMACFVLENLWIAGLIVGLMGLCMVVYYLSYGIFYDEETFLVSSLTRGNKTYSYGDIRCQQLYLLTGGNVIVELRMHNGDTVSIQSYMEGFDAFLDTAFAGWCAQRGIDPENCPFRHDTSQSCWFPSEEEV